MPKVSKNARTSKKPVMVIQKKEKIKKTEIKVELTSDVYNRYKSGMDLSCYEDENGVKHAVINTQKWYGKEYLILKVD